MDSECIQGGTGGRARIPKPKKSIGKYIFKTVFVYRSALAFRYLTTNSCLCKIMKTRRNDLPQSPSSHALFLVGTRSDWEGKGLTIITNSSKQAFATAANLCLSPSQLASILHNLVLSLTCKIVRSHTVKTIGDLSKLKIIPDCKPPFKMGHLQNRNYLISCHTMKFT